MIKGKETWDGKKRKRGPEWIKMKKKKGERWNAMKGGKRDVLKMFS